MKNDLINGRTPEEIKRWISSRTTCNTCPKEHETGCEYGERTEDCQMCIDTLAYIEHLEAKQPKWIGVKDRLPEKHEDGSVDAVLVTDGFLIHMAYYADGLWLFCDSGEMKEPMFYCVTHWMPLPEPPEEERCSEQLI